MAKQTRTTDFAGARREVVTAFPEYFNMIAGLLQPYQTDFSRVGASQGSAMAQDFRAALGRLGASSTGVGSVAGVLGNSLVSNQASQARMQFAQLLLQGTMGLQGQALGAGGPGSKQAPLGQSFLQNLFAALPIAGSNFISRPGG